VTGQGSWPGDDTALTEVIALPPAERRVLAALAVVGRASLSADELAELVEVPDVAPIVDDLERRGFVRRDERTRYSAAGRIGESIRRTDEALATGDRLLGYVTTLARGGRLTPARLVEDTEAILGLSEWAAETQRWQGLLELVKTLQASSAIAQRVPEWLTLLERGRRAARALDDRGSEVWVLEQMAAASASAGDAVSAQRFLREADELRRGRRPGEETETRVYEPAPAAGQAAAGGSGTQGIVLWIIGLIVAAGAGVGVGYAIANDNGSSGSTVTTTPVPVTVTLPGGTVTTQETVTLPATTVLTTTTETTTTTGPTIP
jgi:hypothetical protein